MTTSEACIMLSRGEREEELAALARLVTYARQIAADVGADKARNGLTAALGALLEELGETGLIEASRPLPHLIYN